MKKFYFSTKNKTQMNIISVKSSLCRQKQQPPRKYQWNMLFSYSLYKGEWSTFVEVRKAHNLKGE